MSLKINVDFSGDTEWPCTVQIRHGQVVVRTGLQCMSGMDPVSRVGRHGLAGCLETLRSITDEIMERRRGNPSSLFVCSPTSMTIYFPHWWTRDDALWCACNRWHLRLYRLIVGPVRRGPEPMRCWLEVEL